MLRPLALPLALGAAALLASASHAQINGILIDMADDGNDLTHDVVTTLVHGTATHTAWTAPMTDDCFLMLDAATIGAAGYQVSENGQAAGGLLMFRPGFRIVDPKGTAWTPADGAGMLKVFDTDNDDLITPADLVWEHLWLFMDNDVDGEVRVNQELHRPPSALLSIACLPGPGVPDAIGNLRYAAAAVTDEGSHLQEFVDLFELPSSVPARPSTWGALKARYLTGTR